MLALRQRAVRAAERLPTAAARSTRRHASGHGGDHGHHAEAKDEALGVSIRRIQSQQHANSPTDTILRSSRCHPALDRSLHDLETGQRWKSAGDYEVHRQLFILPGEIRGTEHSSYSLDRASGFR